MADEVRDYNKELWEEFFRDNCQNKILELANHFPKPSDTSSSHKRYLVIDYDGLLEGAWSSITHGDKAVNFLKVRPDIVLKDANDTLHDYVLPIKRPEGWETSGVKITNFKPMTAIRDLRHNNLETLVSVTGTILRKTDVRYKILTAVYKCQRCSHETLVFQANEPLIEPFECENESCGRKGPFKLLKEKSTWADGRKIRLQETLDHTAGREQSLSVLDAVQTGDVECPPLGSIVTATGILRGVQTILNNGKTRDFYPVLDINSLEAQDKEKTIDLTPEDEREMETMSRDEHIIERLIASTVPSVRGHEAVKEACLCSMVSPDNFLLPDGRKLRGYCHVMICGDPGIAKSVMLMGMLGLVPRAQYAAGRSASAKGLTVSVVKDKGGWGEGAWVAEAGMLVLADKAFAIVDELDKFEKEEQRDLNTVLEHAIVPVHKAGIHRDYNARCPIVASLNPKWGRFDRYEPIPKQVNVPPDTLSRFDLVFALMDIPNKREDELIGKHITELWGKTTEVHQKDYQSLEEVSDVWGKDKFTPEVSIDMLRKWIAAAKRIKVRITPECAESLFNHFMSIRLRQADDPDAGIPVVWRTLDGMMRLVISEARLRHGNVTEMRDVERVKALVQESLKITIDPETGEMDSDIISTGTSKSQRDRMKVLKAIISELQQEYKTPVPLEDIESKAEEAGIKKETVQDMIEKLKAAGEAYELSQGRYKVV